MELTEIRDRVFRETRHITPYPSIEDVDDAINRVQDMYIQPVARVRGTAEYIPSGDGEVELDDIAPDIYKIDFVQDITGGEDSSVTIPLRNDSHIGRYGIRFVGDDRVRFTGIPSTRKLLFHYQKKLQPLGMGNVEPEIDPQWHDLYWLGAVAEIDYRRESRFRDRLRDFDRDRRRARKPAGWTVKTSRAWR